MSRPAPSPAPPAGVAADLAHCVGVFETEFDYVYHALRRHGIGPADAEDLVQEVFVVMCRRWAEYDARRPLRPWLAGIAFRVAYNHRQRMGREVLGGFIDREDDTPNQEERLAAESARSLVMRVLAQLPEKHRSLIVSHDIDGVSMREIADTVGIPLFTAHTRLRAARLAFSKAWKRLQTVSTTRATLAPLLRPEALADSASLPPQAPESTRRRALSRARSVALAPAPPRSAPGPARVAPATTKVIVAAVTAGLLSAGITALLLGGRARPAAVAPPKATATWPRPTARLRPDEIDLPAASASPRGHAPPVTEPTPPRPLPAASAPVSSTLAPLAHALGPVAHDNPALGRLRQGLVGYWRFDDGAGSTLARDLSGAGNDCLLRHLEPSLAWTDGTLGGALAFDGEGWLECPKVEAVARLQSEVTIAAWVKRTGSKPHVRAIVTRQFEATDLDVFHLGFRSDLLALRSRIKGGPAYASFPPTRGRWIHVAATLDREGVATLFINGEPARSKTKAGRPTLGGGTTPIIIGGGINGPEGAPVTERLEGVLDELVIYDRALSREEVSALAAGTQPRLSL